MAVRSWHLRKMKAMAWEQTVWARNVAFFPHFPHHWPLGKSHSQSAQWLYYCYSNTYRRGSWWVWVNVKCPVLSWARSKHSERAISYDYSCYCLWVSYRFGFRVLCLEAKREKIREYEVQSASMRIVGSEEAVLCQKGKYGFLHICFRRQQVYGSLQMDWLENLHTIKINVLSPLKAND